MFNAFAEILIFLVTIPFLFVLLSLVIRELASLDMFFTFPNTPFIKFAERGGAKDENGRWTNGIFDHMIPEVPGRILDMVQDKNGAFKLAQPEDVQPQPFFLINVFLHRFVGVYWYGFYPFKHIKEFPMSREKENPKGTGPEDWIIPEETIWVTGLKQNFPRPFVFIGVELADRSKVDLQVVVKFEVVKPYIPVYEFNGDFFTQARSILKGQVLDKLVEGDLTMKQFYNKPKGEVAGLLKEYKDNKPDSSPSDLNQVLIEQVGIKIIGIAINDWNPGDKALVEAQEQQSVEEAAGEARKTKAQKDKDVAITQAEAYEQSLTIKTRADRARQDALAESHGNYVRMTTAALTLPGSDPNVVTRGASDVLEMEAAAGENSKITTVVKDGSRTVVPIGGDKK